jgi:hypothetical protein
VHDETWLSDYFLDKCLKIGEEKSDKSNPSYLAAEAHANLGLSFERLSKFIFNYYLKKFNPL